MRPLEQRIDKLVRRLLLLSEAEAGSTAQKTSHGKSDSRAPNGAKPDSNAAPHPDHDPLIVWFLFELDKRGEEEVGKRTLVARTEVLLERRLKKQPGRIAGAMFEGAAESSEDRDLRILRDYEGTDEYEAAAYEGERAGFCSPASIRQTRLRHRRNPHTGEPMASMDDKTYARQMRQEGMTLSQIALRIGKPKSTIQGWVENVDRRAA